MTVHERLAIIRKDVGLTQTEFSEKMNVSRRAYVNYEVGDRELPSSLILALHKIFSIDPTWLLTGKGEKTSELKKEVITSVVVDVHSFAQRKKAKLNPEQMAKMVLLLFEYYEQVDDVDDTFVRKILELQI